MDDEPAEEKPHRPSPAKLSRTPSWIMLGFILGALFVWMLPRDSEPAAGSTHPPAAPPALAKRPAAPEPVRATLISLSIIEAVFDAWGQHAVWDGDTTEVALWNAATKSFAECYEVKRSGGTLYFRSIPQLTRRPIRHGKPPPEDCPLLFTETEQQYREWRDHGRTERPAESAPPAAEPPPAARPGARTPPVIEMKKAADEAPAKIAPPPAPPIEKPPIEVPPKKQ